jgi:predicted short-subunit dehydrogenase-like oxidoreductase (DUF2520 family)
MVKVTVIGSGNVAQHLITAFENSDSTELVQVFSRDVSKVLHLVSEDQAIDDLSLLVPADLYIISVTDGAVAKVSQNLPFTNQFVVHTSGSMPTDALDPKNRRGVFYPLQTFTKNKPVNFKEIPMCLEAELAGDYALLEKTASAISNHIYRIGSEQRKALHVAAVFVNNFTNHLYFLADKICAENQLPFDILKPLIAETANKVRLLSPDEAQTGPAKRNDINTIETHLSFLKEEHFKNIYRTLTQSIIDHGKKL